MATDTAERKEKLWTITVPPLLWAAHFLACYGVAAIYCEKVRGTLLPVRITIGALTGLALAGLAAVSVAAARRRRSADPIGDHPADTSLDRHRFLAMATLLLAGMSAVAVVWQGMTALFLEDCW